jgi:hypothetical protein
MVRSAKYNILPHNVVIGERIDQLKCFHIDAYYYALEHNKKMMKIENMKNLPTKSRFHIFRVKLMPSRISPPSLNVSLSTKPSK